MTDGSKTRPAAPATGYRLEDQIGFVMRRANQRHTAIFARLMVEQLTPTQWAALVKIGEHGSVSQNQLGRDTAMDVATIKGVVDRLIRRGLVVVGNDPGDSRRNLIRLTEDGAATLAAGLPAAAQITAETLDGLSPGERLLLTELLARIS